MHPRDIDQRNSLRRLLLLAVALPLMVGAMTFRMSMLTDFVATCEEKVLTAPNVTAGAWIGLFVALVVLAPAWVISVWRRRAPHDPDSEVFIWRRGALPPWWATLLMGLALVWGGATATALQPPLEGVVCIAHTLHMQRGLDTPAVPCEAAPRPAHVAACDRAERRFWVTLATLIGLGAALGTAAVRTWVPEGERRLGIDRQHLDFGTQRVALDAVAGVSIDGHRLTVQLQDGRSLYTGVRRHERSAARAFVAHWQARRPRTT